jgi:hypothetical protein
MNAPEHTPDPESAGTTRFLLLARACSAVACATMAGFLYSLKRVNPQMEFDLGVGSLVAALLGGALAWGLWSSAVRPGSPTSSRVPVLLLGGLLLVGTVAAFGYAIKDVGHGALLQVLQGTALALMVLGGIGYVLVRLTRMLNRDEPPVGSTGVPRDTEEEGEQE